MSDFQKKLYEVMLQQHDDIRNARRHAEVTLRHVEEAMYAELGFVAKSGIITQDEFDKRFHEYLAEYEHARKSYDYYTFRLTELSKDIARAEEDLEVA